MASIYTLSNGTQLKLPDNLSEVQVIDAYNSVRTDTLFNTQSLEDTYDIRTGVNDAELRLALSLADENPKETKIVMDNTVGQNNWGYTEQGYLYVTPEGMAARGLQAEKPTLVNGLDFTVYDFVDAFPEIVKGTAAVAFEVGAPMIPGSGSVGGFLGALVSRKLLASSMRAGAGDLSANIGLEAYQTARGENTETVGQVLSKAGTEGAVITGLSYALGLPFAATGKLAGKISESAKNKFDLSGSEARIAGIQESRERAVTDLVQNGNGGKGMSRSEAENLAPVITIKEMIGEEGSLLSKFAVIMEGIGAKNLGDKIPADALKFLDEYDQLYRSAAQRGLSPSQIVDELKISLGKKKIDLLRKTQKELDEMYDKRLGKLDSGLDVEEMTSLFSSQLKAQYSYGSSKFDELYDALDLEGLRAKTLSNKDVADLLNKNLEEAGMDAAELLSNLNGHSSNFVSKLDKVVKIDGNTFRATSKTLLDDIPEEFANFAKQSGQNITEINAKDLLDLSRSIRNNIRKNSGNRNQLRKDVITDKTLMESLDDVVGDSFGAQLKDVNSKYRAWITPYKNVFKNFAETTAQNPEQFVNQIVTKRTPQILKEVIQDLDKVTTQAGTGFGRAAGLKTSDEILGIVGNEYIRWTRDRFNLNNLSNMNIDEIKANAKQVLRSLQKLEVAADPTFKKNLSRILDTKLVKDYKSALNKIAKGDPDGIAELSLFKSYDEAAKFVERVAVLANKLDPVDVSRALVEFENLAKIDKKAGEFYNELMYSEIYSQLLRIQSLSNPGARGTALQRWAQNIVNARTQNEEGLKSLLGKYYQPTITMADITRGALNIDPTAGAISAAGMPFSSLRGVLNLSIIGALKPLSLMYTMKSFAPGQVGWKSMKNLATKGVTGEQAEEAMRPYMKKVLVGAQKANALRLAGRDGALAASVSAYMDEADERLPAENTPMVKKEEVSQAAPQQDLAQIQQQFGANMLNLLQSSQQFANLGQSGLEEGARIARSVA
jgi:hypothetical protein